jgi:hypothetical protein
LFNHPDNNVGSLQRYRIERKTVRLEKYPLKRYTSGNSNPQQLLSVTRVDNKSVRG